MKSFAILLGAAVSLLSAAALADDPYDQIPPEAEKANSQKFWEKRDTAPNEAFVQPNTAAASVKTDAEKLGDKIEAKKDEIKDDMDRKDLYKADPDQKRLGISLEAGGGVGGFLDNRLKDVASAQGQWVARMVFGTRAHLGGEAAYIGSASTVNTLGVEPGATITANGAEGAIRFNVLTGMWQPYAIGGLGWTHYSLGYAQITTSDVQANGDVMTFPIGTGMAWRYNGIVLDSRLSFHPSTSSGLIRNTNLSTWDLQAHAGFEF